MPLEETVAKALLRAALDSACGRLGSFVPLGEVLGAARISGDEAALPLDWLAETRCVHIRGDWLAVSKWGLEYGMDWTHVGRLLRTILNSSGRIGGAANWDVVVAASGLPEQEVLKLVNELEHLGLAGSDADNDCYITQSGWQYLNNGGKIPIGKNEGDANR